MRNLIANVVAALLAAVAGVGVISGVSFAIARSADHDAVWNTVPLVAAAALGLSLLSLLPASVLLQRTGAFMLRNAALLGIAIGLAIPAFLVVLNGGTAGMLALASLCGGAGGVAGLVYYGIYRGLRPNNSSKPTPLRGAA